MEEEKMVTITGTYGLDEKKWEEVVKDISDIFQKTENNIEGSDAIVKKIDSYDDTEKRRCAMYLLAASTIADMNNKMRSVYEMLKTLSGGSEQ